MHRGDGSASRALGVIAGEPRHSLARASRDPLHRFGGVVIHAAFDAGVHVFGQFPHDNDVHIFVRAGDSFPSAHGTQIGVGAEFPPDAVVDAGMNPDLAVLHHRHATSATAGDQRAFQC